MMHIFGTLIPQDKTIFDLKGLESIMGWFSKEVFFFKVGI